jgi:hypothetical protein
MLMQSARTLALLTTLLWASFAAAQPIAVEEIVTAQRVWGEGIVAIGAAYVGGGDHVAVAAAHIRALYAYDLMPVAFKPTKAASVPFRPTFEDALSYFVGGHIPEDHGFALAPYVQVSFENHAVISVGEFAYAMGIYTFRAADMQETAVEYTFGYVRDAAGGLRIALHHSSLPYAPH